MASESPPQSSRTRRFLVDSIKDAARLILVIAVVALAALILFFHVSRQIKIIRLGYQIAEVTHEHRRLLEESKKLAIEAAVLGRSERMAKVAQEELGLVRIRPNQIRKLKKSRLQEEAAPQTD